MKWYPWLRDSYQQIIASQQNQQAHHALLIHTLPGMGEQSLIYAISRWMMCQQPQGQKSCGTCRNCQLMQAGTHPDHYRIESQEGKTGIGIDAVRQTTEKLYEHARMGGAKLVWLLKAERLSEAAANALLKTLEEPASNTWFFITSHQLYRLPATLRSRCVCRYLAPPGTNLALKWLQNEHPADVLQITTALRLSGGAPLTALQLLQPAYAEPRQQLCQHIATALSMGNWYALLPFLDHNQTERLHWLASLFLDARKYQQRAFTWLSNPDQQPLIQQLSVRFSSSQLHELITSLFRCRQQLTTTPGINRELILADLLLTLEHQKTLLSDPLKAE